MKKVGKDQLTSYVFRGKVVSWDSPSASAWALGFRYRQGTKVLALVVIWECVRSSSNVTERSGIL